ncbi:MAG TPA: cupin domain-containing protein, partial [Chloroflexota bacterium]|nr:cupin domain-containing protein [Chloroflexota bacterium]
MAIVQDRESALQDFYQEVRSKGLEPLWLVAHEANTDGPRLDVKPWIWRWRDIRPRMLQAGELMGVGGEGADRRVLTLKNPTFTRASMGSSRTLVAAVQMVYPGEEAPSHRHSMAALRFIIEGEGAMTVVNGEPISMEPGDFLLTPGWCWHGHIHKGNSGPMLWLDVLDVPFVQSLDLGFYEEFSEPKHLQPAERPVDDNLRRYGGTSLLPDGGPAPAEPYSPLFSYKWQRTRETLSALNEADANPYDGLGVVYANPVTGGPVMPTIGASIHMLRPGQSTKAHRHTSTVIYHVAEGRGYSILEGQHFEWERGDTFAVPNWCWHEHTATSETAVLFGADDSPMIKSVALYREETYPENGGHQTVTGD